MKIKCFECPFEPVLSFADLGETSLNYTCRNLHNGKITIKNYITRLNNIKNSENNELKCDDCELGNENFYYCLECNKQFCSDCKKFHSSIHKLIPLKKVNYICFQHNIELNSYCLECCENLCKICKIKHEKHKVIDFNSEKLKNEEIKTIKNYIEKGEEKIILTRKKIDNVIHSLMELIDGIKNLFEKYQDENTNYIILLEQLLNDYENAVKENKLNYEIIQNIKTISQPFEVIQETITSKIEKFTTSKINVLAYNTQQLLSFTQQEKNFNNKKIGDRVNSTTLASEPVYCLALLKNGDLVSSFSDGTIIIYDKETYQQKIKIKEHRNRVFSIYPLKNGQLLTASQDKTIKIISITSDSTYQLDQLLVGHTDWVYRGIELSNGHIASCSYDRTIRIWNKEGLSRLYNCHKIVGGHKEGIRSMFELQYRKEIVSISDREECIRFWEIKNYRNKYSIFHIKVSSWMNAFCQLSEDILGIIGKVEIFLINLPTHELIKSIKKTNNNVIQCIIGLENDTFILGEEFEKNCDLVQFKFDKKNNEIKKISEIRNAHNEYIPDIIQLKNGNIVSGGGDRTIKVWS